MSEFIKHCKPHFRHLCVCLSVSLSRGSFRPLYRHARSADCPIEPWILPEMTHVQLQPRPRHHNALNYQQDLTYSYKTMQQTTVMSDTSVYFWQKDTEHVWYIFNTLLWAEAKLLPSKLNLFNHHEFSDCSLIVLCTKEAMTVCRRNQI
jgi:hypothetical protein